MNRIIDEYKSGRVTYVNDIPNVEVTMKVKADFWFEDAYSTVAKMRLYKNFDVNKIAFWRIGQEDKNIWRWIKMEENSAENK